MRDTVMFLARHELGHRAEYLTLFANILGRAGYRSFSEPSPIKALLHPGPVIVMMLEDHRWSTYVIGLIRALTFRRTVALFFRVRETLVGTSLRHAVKRTLLRMMRAQSLMSILTIVPHSVLCRSVPGAKVDVARLTHGWIDDPQLWDLEFLPQRAKSTPLSERAIKAARTRPILMVSGALDRRKGLQMIARLAGDRKFTDNILIVVAGEVARSEPDLAVAFAESDCILEDRFISNEELNSLYAVSDLVWCVYSPSYDQASGIFGRAVVKVRRPLRPPPGAASTWPERTGSGRVKMLAAGHAPSSVAARPPSLRLRRSVGQSRWLPASAR